MPDKVFSVSGNKISSFIIDENSLKFSSKEFTNADEFRESFDKKLSLTTKTEVKYDKIKSITKEDNEKEIKVKFKSWAGIPMECVFSFSDNNDMETFFGFMENDMHFNKTEEKLTPFKAIISYAIGLILTIAFTIFAYNQAINIANGTEAEGSSGKTRTFNFLVGMLGDKGVLVLGGAIACYLLYKILIRFSNPPSQTSFLPPQV